MSLSHETLWAYAQGALAPAEAAAVDSTLRADALARAQLEDIRFAQALVPPPEAPVPPLPEASLERIARALEGAQAPQGANALDSQTLWARAEGSLPAGEARAVDAALAADPSAQEALEAVRFAQSLLHQAEPPPLPAASAARIERALRQASERKAPWWKVLWPFELSPAFGLAGAVAALALAVLLTRRQAPEPLPAVAVTPTTPAPAPRPVEPVPEPAPAAQLATVTRARKATVDGAALSSAATLAVGARVETAAGGALALELAGQTRATLAASTSVTLAKLERGEVAFALERGALTVSAAHDPSRVLKVVAGELTVTDVGTRFQVSRAPGWVRVEVEEGAVEVQAAGKTVSLVAGHAVELRAGELTEEALAPSKPPEPPRPAPPQVPPAPLPLPPPPPPAPAQAPAQASPEPGVAIPPPPPPPGGFAAQPQEPGGATQRPGGSDEQSGVGLGALEQRLRKYSRSLQAGPSDGGR